MYWWNVFKILSKGNCIVYILNRGRTQNVDVDPNYEV